MPRSPFYRTPDDPRDTDDVSRFRHGHTQPNGQVVDTERPSAPPTVQPEGGFAAMRRAEPCNTVLPATRRWLQTLPEDVQPLHLASAFPRIANHLATAWPVRSEAEIVLDGLLVDRRGGRRGFPESVQLELVRLWHYLHRSAAAPLGGITAGHWKP
jgi:hypothetical protein